MQRSRIAIALAVSALLVVSVAVWDHLRTRESATNSSWVPYTAAVPIEPTTTTIAVIGDSFVGGSAEGGRESANWTAILAARLYHPDTPVYFEVSGKSGAGYAHPGTDRTTFVTEADRMVYTHTDIAVFFGSINDLHNPSGVPSGVSDAIARAKERSPAVQILVIGPAWTRGALTPDIEQVAKSVGQSALAAGAQYVDPITERWFFGQESALVGQDGLNPNNAGHIYLADKIQPLIEDMVMRLKPHS